MVGKLVPTGVLARELGVDVRTLHRWVKAELLVPDLTTPGGHMRWNVERVRRELREQRRRDE
ncbi:MAG: MerR family transcriptional regulator [Pseudonocardiaceae bacterium]|nr:MerR family transcriptional regulator [Pseudonocardiaceae bacterium]